MNEHLTHPALIDYLHGELAPDEDAAMLAHLECCEPCRDTYNAEARISEALRAYARASVRELPAGVVNGIHAAIERDTAPAWWSRLGALTRPAIALPVAAALIVGLYFGATTLHGAPVPMIEAAYYLDDHAALTSTLPLGEGSVVPKSLENETANGDQRWVAAATVRTRTPDDAIR